VKGSSFIGECIPVNRFDDAFDSEKSNAAITSAINSSVMYGSVTEQLVDIT
jgi:hypothetical protein